MFRVTMSNPHYNVWLLLRTQFHDCENTTWSHTVAIRWILLHLAINLTSLSPTHTLTMRLVICSASIHSTWWARPIHWHCDWWCAQSVYTQRDGLDPHIDTVIGDVPSQYTLNVTGSTHTLTRWLVICPASIHSTWWAHPSTRWCTMQWFPTHYTQCINTHLSVSHDARNVMAHWIVIHTTAHTHTHTHLHTCIHV